MEGKSLRGLDVVDALEQIKSSSGLVPQRIQTDNGSDFVSKQMDRWAYEQKVKMDFPGLRNKRIIPILSRSMDRSRMNVQMPTGVDSGSC
jgi:transposase InsO family protein